MPVWRITPGSATVGADLRNPAHHRVLAEDGDQPLAGVDSVLQRDDRRSRSYQRPHAGAGAFHVPQLHAEHDVIDWADAGRIVGSLNRVEMDFATGPEHGEPARAHRCQMGAACDERHVVAGLR